MALQLLECDSERTAWVGIGLFGEYPSEAGAVSPKAPMTTDVSWLVVLPGMGCPPLQGPVRKAGSESLFYSIAVENQTFINKLCCFIDSASAGYPVLKYLHGVGRPQALESGRCAF